MRVVFAAAALLLTVPYLRADGPEDMVAFLKKQVAANPSDIDANVRLVETLLQRERFDEADDAIKAALAVSAQASELHSVHGDLLLREGHVLEADAEYKTGFKLDKKNARALFGISQTFRLAGLGGKAAGLVRAAHQLDPADQEIMAAVDELDQTGPGSVARLEKILANPVVAGNSEIKNRFETELAEAKLLNGKHTFELASPYQHYQLPYRVLYDGKRPTGFGLTIAINGTKSELRVDTGAHGVVVSSGFAAKAGVQRIGGSKIGGIGNQGAVDIWIGYAERMQIGDIEFRNIIVEVREKGSVDDSGGLLGTDIFKRFLVEFNFFQGRINLDPLPGPAWDGYTPVDRYEGLELKDFTQFFLSRHHVLLPTLVSEKQKSDQTKCLFLIDTGAGFNSISTNLAPSVTKIRNNEYMTVKGISGKVKMLYQADSVILQFASYRQTNLGLTSLDESNISRSAGLEVSGILGLPLLALFRSFTLDYRDERVNFDYKPR